MKKKTIFFSLVRRCQLLPVLLSLFFLRTCTIVRGLGSSSTIAAIHGFNTVCGILVGKSQGIQCFQQGRMFSALPNISYEAISGGRDFFCGLSSGGSDLFCWDTGFSNSSIIGKIVYHNTLSPLTDLAVGDDQVCAVQARTGIIQCWEREGRLRLLSPALPPVGETGFLAITSGDGFSCGIVKDERNVLCWGENGIGDFIEREFGSLSMLSLVAGKSHVCGIAYSGLLICKGLNDSGQLDVPSEKPFHFSELALSGTYSCALQRNNGSVICWGNGGNTSVITDQKIQKLSFESIISGADYTCGLRSDDFTVNCWGPGWSGKLDTLLPLPSMIPGKCVRESCQLCGVFPGSEALCSGDTVICRSCVIELPLPLSSRINLEAENVSQPLPSPVAISPSYLVSSLPSKKEKHRPLWAYEIFGFVGIISGIFAFAYFIYLKRLGCSKVRKDRDVVKDKELNSIGSSNAAESAFVASNASSAPQSRSSSITQLSSMALGRTRSWDSSSKHVEKAEVFTLCELAAATKNFSLENKIGRGSFGTVYKGILSNAGCEVAIKREEICARSKRGYAFESELMLLTRVHHKHLVGLVGFCEEQNERLLVYKYMSNGALHDHLHSYNTQKSSSPLNSWRMRIKIALDAARGIEYLHNYAVPPIIHRDIKSSNILLDANWVGRVSDFGLSLKGPENEEGSMSIKPVGTVGYIDPEYYVLKVLTTKSDVYGFGVVLLELLTGKKAVFKEGEKSGPTGVVEYAGPFIVAGEVWKVLDKRVEMPVMNESEAVELLAYTAMMCVNLEGKERPTMSDVVSNLERALTLCKGSSGTFSPNFYSFSEIIA
ncbi:putative serine/threonine-protein kinase-like protein CCR3 [Chenopodium quinoa]|uniref:non-specific serine/threonine protein kinase n=1 Tax=Chenopodium quinoa TaxID=63459 RepID=A0A803KRI0_CHEQI|nr:putative serine/threonine-protein kinase-like protein CCR3 [Chenopodium quinoa]